MKTNIDSLTGFVLRYFEPGRFDSRKAYARFRERFPQRRWRLWAAIPAAAAVAAILLLLHGRNAWTEYRSYDIAQSFMLSDGTRVTLAPGSTLRYQPRKAPRRVQMTGKVRYAVVHDESVPFRVDASAATVIDLGTVFQVAESPDSTRVDVTEGRVRFTAAAMPEDGIVLEAGETATLAGGQILQGHALPNPDAWATGRFTYEDTPLDTVLSELSSYFQADFTCAGASGRRLSAEFSTDEGADEILNLIEQALDVRIER